MPKTTKRAATKRAARVARAHATELTNLEVKDPTARRRSPGYKAPARGIARYPWASVITLCLLALVVVILYANHIGPFALPKVAPKSNPANTSNATLRSGASPCTDAAILSQITNTAAAPTTAEFDKITHSYKTEPAQTIDPKKLYCAGFNTNKGLVVVELDPKIAPKSVNNFVFLANHNYYDGTVFHRVNQDLPTMQGQLHIAQGGDAQFGNDADTQKRGTGNPGYKFADEPVKGDYLAGTIAMANSGANTNGSQFFINITDNKTLPKQYNLFGRVVQGLDVVKKFGGPSDVDKTPKPDSTIEHLVVVPAS